MKLQHSLVVLFALVFCSSLTLGQHYIHIQSVESAGGFTSYSPSYTVWSTVGQPAVGSSSSSSYRQASGFWNEYEALTNYYAVSYTVLGGWNMISLPQTVSDYSKSAIFPDAVSSAFSFVGGYRQESTLQNGPGYWLKFPNALNISVIGISRMMDTVAVQNKWNMIGSVASTIDTSAITQIPPVSIVSRFFGFDNGYYSSSTIEPGKAYWVKTNAAGSLVLGSTSASAKLASNITNDETEQLNAITVGQPVKTHGGKARSQKLLFGSAGGKNINADYYEMPPIPPIGAFDVRFASGRSLEVVPQKLNEPREYPLSVQSNGMPLKLSWTMKEKAGLRYSFIEKQGTKVLSQHRLQGTNAITITGSAEKQYSLKVENIPTQYALYQNYPNPFNPSTTIRFDLPEHATVALKVFNVLGQQVAALINNQEMEEGQQTIAFDASSLASGTYFYRISAVGIKGNNFQNVNKMLLLK